MEQNGNSRRTKAGDGTARSVERSLIRSIKSLPKTDLHCHLDGSMRPETILDIARIENIHLGVDNISELKQKLVCGRKVSSLPEFLRAFDITCAVMQSEKSLERIAFELAEDAAKENVWYLEVRFSPILATDHGLSVQHVLRAVNEGLRRAEERYPIRTGIIVCALRNLDPKVSVDLARAAVACMDHGVVGFDLAQAERGNPAELHREAFAIAQNGGLHLTVHAGEDDGPQSIRQAIEACHAERIGHGRTLEQDPELEQFVITNAITVECCPSSNVQINLVPRFEEHPLKGFLQRGVHVTLNTDNRLLTGITVTDEYLRCVEHLGLSWDQLSKIALNGFQAAFLPEGEKKSLIEKVSATINEINKTS